MSIRDEHKNKISFTHIINPFSAPEGSEHKLASRITFESLRVACEYAQDKDIKVSVNAVILPGDEITVESPVERSFLLSRTVQDVRQLKPRRTFPLISDILKLGASEVLDGYLIYTNMDIAVQPDFYLQLQDIINEKANTNVPFIVYRRNISECYSRVEELPKMYKEEGTLAYGYDCFVFPAELLKTLELGNCCIGSAHFDNLLVMALDATSGFKLLRIKDKALTFHIGNEIGWVKNMEYIEHNLKQSLAAIELMRKKWEIPEDSVFSNMDKVLFQPQRSFMSWFFRRVKSLPLFGEIIYRIKKTIGRSH